MTKMEALELINTGKATEVNSIPHDAVFIGDYVTMYNYADEYYSLYVLPGDVYVYTYSCYRYID